VQYFNQPVTHKKPPVELSPREKEIILLLLEGKWTKEIASQVGLGMTTISTHKQRIFEKLEVRNIVELYVKIQNEMPELIKQSGAGGSA
jgi:two-component system invasion response regulator UvrY